MTFLFATPSTQPLPEVLIQMLMVVGVVAMGVILTISIRGKIARKHAATPPPRVRLEQVKSRQLSTQDHHAISAELHDSARRLAAHLDNKAERLEQLLEQAESRIAELTIAVESVPPTPETARRSPPESRPSAVPVAAIPNEPDAITREIERRPDDPIETTNGRVTPSADEGLDLLTRSVYELADAGHESVSIARTLDEQIGKVELILALRAS